MRPHPLPPPRRAKRASAAPSDDARTKLGDTRALSGTEHGAATTAPATPFAAAATTDAVDDERPPGAAIPGAPWAAEPAPPVPKPHGAVRQTLATDHEALLDEVRELTGSASEAAPREPEDAPAEPPPTGASEASSGAAEEEDAALARAAEAKQRQAEADAQAEAEARRQAEAERFAAEQERARAAEAERRAKAMEKKREAAQALRDKMFGGFRRKR